MNIKREQNFITTFDCITIVDYRHIGTGRNWSILNTTTVLRSTNYTVIPVSVWYSIYTEKVYNVLVCTGCPRMSDTQVNLHNLGSTLSILVL